jgi:ABC-type transport system involved in multi-copper enzyme maturation permease subunit
MSPGATFGNAVRSEWRKLVSVRMWQGLALAAVLYTAVNAGILIGLSGVSVQGQSGTDLTDPLQLRALYGTVGSASALVLVLGILSMTSEYRHQTITATLLATPGRARIVGAKMVAAAALAAVIGVLCVAVVTVVMLVGLPFKDHADLQWGAFASASVGAVLGFAVYAVLGVGFGALVRNQIAAVVAGLMWVLLVESLVVTFLPQVGEWLPGGALQGVMQTQSLTGADYLAPWLAVLVLLGYALVFAALAVRLTLRRDVT